MKSLLPYLAIMLPLAACNNNSNEKAAEKSADDTPGMMLSAELIGAETGDGGPVGDASLDIGSDGTKLRLSLVDMKAGIYGMHLHETGLCEAPDFKSAGGHWNPADTEHGLKNPKGHHGGDMPNLEVGADGAVNQTIHIAHLIASEADKLMDEDGAALVIHAGPDDNVSDPSGNSGARIICGVFRKAEAE